MNKRLSVLIPNLNYANFLEQCIKSIIVSAESQIHEIEIIIQDGMSTDNSFEIVNRIMELNPEVNIHWRQEKDNSQAQALSRAFEYSVGDFVLWLNSDEYLQPGILKKFLTLAANGKYEIYYGDTRHVDKNGVLIRYQVRPYRARRHILNGNVAISTCSTFIMRRVLEDYEFNWHLRGTPDLDMFSWLARRTYKWKHIGTSIGNFRWHKSQITNDSEIRFDEELKELKEKFNIPWGESNNRHRVIYKISCGIRLIILCLSKVIRRHKSY